MNTSVQPPAVEAIIATKDRRELLLKAIDGILGQDYAGDIRVTVVFDQVPVDFGLERDDSHRSVRTMANTRTSGLAGGRNTGLLAAEHGLVAFCDDDDIWRPEKVSRQVARMELDATQGCVTGILVHTHRRQVPRIPQVDRVSDTDLHQSRLTGAHPSSFVFEREWLLRDVGLVDEDLPYGYGEDFDLLLRAATAGSVSLVSEPLVDVLWHSGSFFAQRWNGMAEGLGYVIDKHPTLAADPKGFAWIEGQRAFALAAKGGDTKAALQAARRSIRSRVREPRGWLAIGVALKLLNAERIVRVLNGRGRGI